MTRRQRHFRQPSDSGACVCRLAARRAARHVFGASQGCGSPSARSHKNVGEAGQDSESERPQRRPKRTYITICSQQGMSRTFIARRRAGAAAPGRKGPGRSLGGDGIGARLRRRARSAHREASGQGSSSRGPIRTRQPLQPPPPPPPAPGGHKKCKGKSLEKGFPLLHTCILIYEC